MTVVNLQSCCFSCTYIFFSLPIPFFIIGNDGVMLCCHWSRWKREKIKLWWSWETSCPKKSMRVEVGVSTSKISGSAPVSKLPYLCQYWCWWYSWDGNTHILNAWRKAMVYQEAFMWQIELLKSCFFFISVAFTVYFVELVTGFLQTSFFGESHFLFIIVIQYCTKLWKIRFLRYPLVSLLRIIDQLKNQVCGYFYVAFNGLDLRC